MIRVVMLILDYYPRVGGAQQQLALQAPLLQNQGVDVTVLTRRFPGLAAQETIAGVPVIRLPAPPPKPLAAMLFSLSALWHLYRLQPDIIHAYSFLSPLTTAVIAHRLWNIPVVAKVLRGGVLGDIVRVQNKLLGLHRLVAYKKHTSTFITISQEIDAELAEIGIPSAQRTFIPNGVDIHRFSPLPPPQKTALRTKLQLPDGPLVLFTGRLVPEKRLEQLLAIWPAVRAQHPTARLLLLGAGPLENELRQQAGPGVIFGGRVDDVAPYLQTADLFVLPSVSEGLSNALLEAMAAGLPVVATAVGGAPDVIVHRESGWLITPDNPQELETAVLTLLAAPSARTQLGMAARAKIVQDFALDQVAHRLKQLYDRVLANEINRGSA